MMISFFFVLVGAVLANVAMFNWLKSWFRWVHFGMALLLLAIGGSIPISNYLAGCYGAPKVVPFQQGMTLCPGQSARIVLK